MTKTFEIIKDLEKQKSQIGENLITDEKLNPENSNQNMTEPDPLAKAQISENQLY